MPLTLLSQTLVSTYTVPTGKRKIDLFDTQTKGLVLEVRASGGKTYYLRYTNSRQKTRVFKLADARDVTLSQARQLADKTRTRIAMGEDPCETKAAIRSVPTFAQFIADQYMPFVKSYKRSWSTDECNLRVHLLPRFGKKHLDEITRQDIVRMHSDRLASGAAPGSANRLLIMMRYIYNLALKWEVPGLSKNPTKGVPMFEENNKIERFLTEDEARRLYEAVCRSDNKMLRFIVPMLLLTGARKREVLDAKWEDFDIARRIWRIPTTKAGTIRHVPLSDSAIQLLAEIPDDNLHGYVFANPETGQPYKGLYSAWDVSRKRAGLPEVRMHDLRHSFASMLVNNGRTLYEVQNILGHTQVKTTQRYSHLSNDTLVQAANCAGNAVGKLFVPSIPSLAIPFSDALPTNAVGTCIPSTAGFDTHGVTHAA